MSRIEFNELSSCEVRRLNQFETKEQCQWRIGNNNNDDDDDDDDDNNNNGLLI